MKPFTLIAVVVFALVAVVHLHRLFAGWEVIVSGTAIPLWASGVGVVVAGGLAFMLWLESRAPRT